MEIITDEDVEGIEDMTPTFRVNALINATEPLLALYAVVSDAMEEKDWNTSTAMARIRRAWEECTADLGG